MSKPDLAEYLRLQGHYCGNLGSPLYELLLDRAADDLAAGGVVAAVLDGYPLEPILSAMALRFMGNVHRLVLEGRAPGLAAHYPSVGGDGDASRTWPAFHAVVAENVPLLRDWMSRGVQTNEVGRSAALVCGFLEVARRTGMGLRCLEIGASAGLNLRWDRFRYEAPNGAWGDAASPVVLRGFWAGDGPTFDVDARVVERAGCDPHPLDPTTDEGRLTLVSYVWPDQAERLALLRAACEVARRAPVTLERASAPDWLASRLAKPADGLATVVYHSIVFQYLDEPTRDRLRTVLDDAGARATTNAPFAWLRMEPAGKQADLHLVTWPGGEERLVATTGYHGRDVRLAGATTVQ
jgi:hypothetical protein